MAFNDINCHTHMLEVDEQVYKVFLEFKKNEKRQENEFDRHIEHKTLSEIELYCRAFRKEYSLDEQILHAELYQEVCRVIGSLPKRQRKRAILYFEHELTYEQIADLESRSFETIRESIHAVRGKILEHLENFFKEI